MSKVCSANPASVRRFFRVVEAAIRHYCANRNSQRAVTLTYYTLFAIVPIAALLFGIAKGFNIEETVREALMEKFSTHQELMEMVYQFADTTLKQASGGVVAGVGIVALIWTVVWVASNVEGAFNSVWMLPQRSNLLHKFSDYITIILLTPILLVVLSSAGVLLRNLLNHAAEFLPALGGVTSFIVMMIIKLTPLAVSVVLFTLIYFLVPNTKVKFSSALFAGIIAGVVYQLFQDGFIFLQRSIYRYNRIYGSFAVLPLFLTWVKISWQLVLFGAELSYADQNIDSGRFELERSKAASNRHRLACQLALARLIYRRQAEGNGSTGIDELLEKVNLTRAETETELTTLCESGLIYRTDEEDRHHYIAALPPESTRVEAIIEQLETYGNNELPENLAAEQAVLEEFDRSRRQSPSNLELSRL